MGCVSEAEIQQPVNMTKKEFLVHQIKESMKEISKEESDVKALQAIGRKPDAHLKKAYKLKMKVEKLSEEYEEVAKEDKEFLEEKEKASKDLKEKWDDFDKTFKGITTANEEENTDSAQSCTSLMNSVYKELFEQNNKVLEMNGQKDVLHKEIPFMVEVLEFRMKS